MPLGSYDDDSKSSRGRGYRGRVPAAAAAAAVTQISSKANSYQAPLFVVAADGHFDTADNLLLT